MLEQEKRKEQLVIKLTTAEKTIFFNDCKTENITPSDAVRLFIRAWYYQHDHLKGYLQNLINEN